MIEAIKNLREIIQLREWKLGGEKKRERVMEMGRREVGTACAWAAKPVRYFGQGTDKQGRR